MRLKRQKTLWTGQREVKGSGKLPYVNNMFKGIIDYLEVYTTKSKKRHKDESWSKRYIHTTHQSMGINGMQSKADIDGNVLFGDMHMACSSHKVLIKGWISPKMNANSKGHAQHLYQIHNKRSMRTPIMMQQRRLVKQLHDHWKHIVGSSLSHGKYIGEINRHFMYALLLISPRLLLYKEQQVPLLLVCTKEHDAESIMIKWQRKGFPFQVFPWQTRFSPVRFPCAQSRILTQIDMPDIVTSVKASLHNFLATSPQGFIILPITDLRSRPDLPTT